MKLVSRRGWGARRPNGRTPLSPRELDGVAVHYSAAQADEQDRHARCAARVRAIQRFHMDGRGWDDIAYSHVFCRHGYVFTGRGFGVRTAANGTNAANDAYHAVCFLGNDTARRDDVTEEGRRALAAILFEYQRRYPRATRVVPHSQFTSTACPGDELRRLIRDGAWKRYRESWPTPLPRWFWVWARWRLGRGEFRRYGPASEAHRPRIAPRVIPDWAWDRLRLLVRGDPR